MIKRRMATFVPGAVRLFHRGTGGTCSARYCYAVWLRHLVLAAEHGLLDRPPRRVVEIGPGDSLGTGIAAITDAGLTVACSLATPMPSAIDRRELAPRFAGLSDEDLTTGNPFVRAVRH